MNTFTVSIAFADFFFIVSDGWRNAFHFSALRAHRKKYGEIIETEHSRFLNELPEEDLEWSNKKQLEPEVIKQRGKANLANLKTMLS